MHPFQKSLILGVCLSGFLYAQVVPYQAGREVPLSNMDCQTVAITAGSTASVAFEADPSSNGGDVFQIRLSDPGIAVSLTLPNGVVVNSSTAGGLGFDFAFTSNAPEPGKLDPTLLGYTGPQLFITLPAGQPSGTYTVTADATSLTTPSALIAVYLSSGSVGVGVSADAPLYRTGETAILTAAIFDGAAPLTVVTATAAVSNSRSLNGQGAITNLQLISQQQIDPETVQYTYAVTLTNNGAAATDVSAIAAGNVSSGNIISGEIIFGDVAANATAAGLNQFVVQVSPIQPFDPQSVFWSIRSLTSVLSIPLVDSGPYDGAPGDGLFTGSFVPSAPGDYVVSLKATGTSVAGIHFSRRTSTQFQVSNPLANFVAGGFSDVAQTNPAGAGDAGFHQRVHNSTDSRHIPVLDHLEVGNGRNSYDVVHVGGYGGSAHGLGSFRCQRSPGSGEQWAFPDDRGAD